MKSFILIICLSVFIMSSCRGYECCIGFVPLLPFMQAVEEDDMEKVKSLLSIESCSSEKFKDKDIDYLAKEGICSDVNVRDLDGKTALFYVKSVEMAEYLVSQGADINIKDKYQETPLHTARNAEVAEFFIEKGFGYRG